MLQSALVDAMEADGIGMHWGAAPAAVERLDDGLWLSAADGRQHGPFDELIWAIGRQSSTQNIGLDAAGIEAHVETLLGEAKAERGGREHLAGELRRLGLELFVGNATTRVRGLRVGPGAVHTDER